MASLGHIAIGVAVSRHAQAQGTRRFVVALVAAALAYLPDIDVIGFWLGVPYDAAWGHRGATHSLTLALLGGLVCGIAGRWLGISNRRAAVMATLLLASHGVLDAMTDGGLGVAFFWPLSETRYFFDWRPIPVARLGLNLHDTRQLHVFIWELVCFAPFLLYGILPTKLVNQNRP